MTKVIKTAWGSETVLNNGQYVVRLYESAKGLTIDMSQVKDCSWRPYYEAMEKYNSLNIKLKEYDKNKIIAWFTKE